MTQLSFVTAAWRVALGLVLLASVLSLGTRRAWAQDDPDIVDDGPPQKQAEVENFVIDESNFDQWIFGGRMHGGNASAARVKIDTSLENQITAVSNIVPITESQKKKLRLAGRGDIKRFFDQVEEKRARFQLVRKDRNKFGNFYQEIVPLQTAVNRGLFREESLFYKTLSSTLTAEQSDLYEKYEEERRGYRWRARVDLVIEMWGGTLGLNTEQRRKLANLIVTEVPTPKSLGQQDNYFVLYKLSGLSSEKVRPLFNDTQWKAFDRQVNQAKMYRSMLAQQGYDSEDLTVATVKPREKEAKSQ